ncbi:type I-E CRISPR-associated protein Cas7/Cse4/CasC [Streptomyces chrestomyceticus]|uniref:type I-E CRISPR-associated protein Cas7/Cse4/CasC n=1 Tax=Streptomyces chrestomyceticus TaxID=68185 RepID=UPI0033CB76D3
MSIFIDVHIVHSFPLSNLNRDYYGSPKVAVYGGVERGRVSSAALKRGSRTEIEKFLGDKALRTRRVPGQVAAELEARGWTAEEAAEAGRNVALAPGVGGLGIEEAGTTNVMLYLPAAAIGALADLVEEQRTLIDAAAKGALAEAKAGKSKKTKTKADREIAKRIQEVLATRNASIAAFGRMLANAPEVTVDGAISVAHAITTHATEEQSDFFTAVDDVPGDDNGSAHMGHGAYTSGSFYKYSSISLDTLITNLGHDRDAARELVRAYLAEFAVHVPRAKKNSTAPFTPPALAYVTVRSDRPVSLAGAFEAPVVADETTGWTSPSIKQLDEHAQAVHAFFGPEPVIAAAYTGTAADLGSLTALGRHIPQLSDLVENITTAAFDAETPK